MDYGHIDTYIDINLAEQNDWIISNEILNLINEHRIKQGRFPLIKDSLYATAYAVDHSNYMIANKLINHNNFLIRSQGLKSRGATRVSENIAYAYHSASSVLKAWLNSDSHRNTLEGDFTHIGFGVLRSPEQKYYFTLLLYK